MRKSVPEQHDVVAQDGHVDGGPLEIAGRRERPMPPLQRLMLLCDEGSLQLIRSTATSEHMGDKGRAGDGVVGGYGTLGGRPICCYAQDASFAGGSVGAQHAGTIVRVQRLALEARTPVIGFVESGGARMQEGLAALNGYARIFAQNVALSGRVPQISVITGTSAGGGCYSPALTDFVVMTRRATMFLTGPGVVQEVTGERTTAETLGGPGVHERNGVCQFVVENDLDSIFLVRQLLGYLPQHAGAEMLPMASADPDGPDPGGLMPTSARRAYDVRDVARSILDADSMLEVAPKWAPNLVTAFARLEGRAIGLVANQPRELGGVLDAEAGQKGARFVRTCNAYGLPLLVLVDTPGFLPGSSQERDGVIRHGAKLLHAFAEATVPRFTVVLRKAFGGAYITMNSKDLGADLALAWPSAELGIMGAHQAVGIIHKRELVGDDGSGVRERLADAYAVHHLSAATAASRGHIDDVVRPDETRGRIARALATLATRKREVGHARNIPL